MSRSPQVGQTLSVRLGDDDYAGEVVEVTEEAITLAIRVEHDPRSVLPATGSVTWKGKRKQAFSHAEMSCLTTVLVRLPRPQAKPARIDRRIAVDIWEKPGSQNLLASGYTRDLTGDRAELDLNHPLPPDATVEVALYLGKDVLRIPAHVAPAPADQPTTLHFDPTSAARSTLTRYIFAHLRREKP
ncbi:hypothetical protein D3C87_966840 [compost metagenome]